ncbi:UNVERIFIED_CONTAM: hypothetical protein HDU68_002477 [Siphonaria sp. JEL0065]|nr:hypothetical protein HDU68_002477 [Siphonaria sp. JEL0065]
MKIYTRTGDKGTSALYTGERRPKDDAIFEALGNVDELSSYLGLAREFCDDTNNGLSENLEKIQCILLDVGANVATPRNSASEFKRNRTEFDVDGYLVMELEAWIDELDQSLEPLKNFILPSGGKAGSTLHVARNVCRSAERKIVPLIAENIADASVGKYINRLSDYLFTAARFAAKSEGKPERIYKKPKE